MGRRDTLNTKLAVQGREKPLIKKTMTVIKIICKNRASFFNNSNNKDNNNNNNNNNNNSNNKSNNKNKNNNNKLTTILKGD